MKFRILLLCPLLLLVGCSPNSEDDSDEGVERLTVSNIHIYQEDGLMHVYYDNQTNPFKVEGHKYSYMKVNGQRPFFESHSYYLHSQGYFDVTPEDKHQAYYKIEWFDKDDVKYLRSDCKNVRQYDSAVVYPNGYTNLVFQDEFSGEALDTTKWGYNLGNGDNGWGNGEVEYYTKENATVNNGVLHITAKKEQKEGFEYTSARISSKGHYSVKYGYIEARIALPEVEAMWPAFWMVSNDNAYGEWPKSGEIDIVEANGGLPTNSSSALHFTTKGGNKKYEAHTNTFKNGSTLSKFHLYACKWEQSSISFYVDGEEHLKLNNTQWQTVTDLDNPYAPYDKEFHFILNLAIGGNYTGYKTPPANFESTEMIVDYIRVFQK